MWWFSRSPRCRCRRASRRQTANHAWLWGTLTVAGVSWRAGDDLRLTQPHSCMHSPMNFHSKSLAQAPTQAIPSVKHSGIFVQCFMALLVLPAIYIPSPVVRCSRKELKLFVCHMQWSQTAIYSHQLICQGLESEKGVNASCILQEHDQEQRRSWKTVPLWGLLILVDHCLHWVLEQ